ncbi:wax ester/triacylglycerol synthase family O-acyltransferase [Aquincola sp. S2]|uniref:diacylglycerol O-acyltransferase n=1 Tax=Pseudaquabacterium terrae TaxID=2732868 RepID=A0ABX2EGA1_9BURK|nr:wax ester/triacylglycerol synthase family O-acyltransferase [Aquabacterium terrae]NRF67667.1 wax ester/triacylglycerol synthase family O-acyltransferase [Aquabacterium terrae]
MKHLSGMDASFLHLETPEMPMHVGSLQILDLPEGHDGDYYEDVKRYMAERMHLAEVFQRKLALMPFELANPVWVDDEDVDLDYHVRHVILPRPGTWEQLEKYVARLHSSLLDRSRPLWEIYVIEGLHTGQVALYNKMHHSTIDGAAGVAVIKALLGTSAVPAPIKPPRPRPRTNQYQLGIAELAAAAVVNTALQYGKLFKALPAGAKALGSLLLPQPDDSGKRLFRWPKGWRRIGRTPLNVAITNQRSFAARSMPLDDIKRIARASGSSVNDVVLALGAGALKRYFADYRFTPQQPLVAAVPVSLREAGNTDPNNQVSMMRVGLATDIDDPVARLAAINASAKSAKQFTGRIRAAIPTDFPSPGVPWLMGGFALLYGRSGLANRLPPLANVAISNVPGPQVPLYIAGARVAAYYPVSIPTHGIALNMTVQSYNGALEVGLTACRRAMPDVADLADYIVDEQRKLLALVESQASAAAALSVAMAPLPKARRAARTAVKRSVKTAARAAAVQ